MAVRGKKGKKKKREAPNMPVNSFADIAFLLIVFFVIASTLSQTTGVITDIPSGEKSETKQDKTAIIKLQSNVIMLNDSKVDVEGLRKRLADMKLSEKTGQDKIVLLETVGAAVDYQTYYSAMTAISGAGGVIAIVKEGDGE
jgi:biopolymer transport protein ExbD